MKRFGRIIPIYLIKTVLPYFALSWLLLSAILFVQQASRFSDVFFNANVPAHLVWQLSIALIPNVIAFTSPAAMLIGVVIGLAKMQTDSELVAVRATGIGDLQIAVPIAVIGIVLSGAAFLVNVQGIPFAARLVRQVAIQTAISKLDSPVEPGIFNSEVAGYTIFVRGVDVEAGRWRNIFIFNEDSRAGSVRLITSDHGRIDNAGERSELVLTDASVTTLPATPGGGPYATEKLGEVRIAVRTGRGDLVERLGKRGSINELGLGQLAEVAASSEGRERTEAEIHWMRRVVLSITPFIFSLLGTFMVLRFSRGGRGLGTALALAALIGYYVVAFVGEQLARTGYVSVLAGGLLPVAASAAAIVAFRLSSRPAVPGLADVWDNLRSAVKRRATDRLQFRNKLVDMTTGLRDLDISLDLIKYFLTAALFLGALFLIFTAFDVWRYAALVEGGPAMLARYLFYLMPFTYVQLAPSAAMVAVLAAYVTRSRQNEIVTWTAAGQSVYRLLMPCFFLAVVLGIINWQVQEQLLPRANLAQDELRSVLRGGGAAPQRGPRTWSSSEGRIYAFASDNDKGGRGSSASDNERRDVPFFSSARRVSVYTFHDNRPDLQFIYRAPEAEWRGGTVMLKGATEEVSLATAGISRRMIEEKAFDAEADPFVEPVQNPSALATSELAERAARSTSDAERRNLRVTLDSRYATLAMPLVVALLTAPFALSLSRKGKSTTVGYAVLLWLLFTGASAVFQQLGLNGLLSPGLAVWTPLVAFSLVGIFLLSKVRT